LKRAVEAASAAHKGRRQMYLFFKAIKQSLKIKQFYGSSENAAMTRIRTALIVRLSLRLLKARAKSMAMSFASFISAVKTMLFQGTSLFEWPLDPSPPPVQLPCWI
jgi:putative transposase